MILTSGNVVGRAVAAGLIVGAGLAGCSDSDVDEGCTSGGCGGAAASSTDASSTAATAGGGGDASGGGGGGAPACAFDDTAGIPCDVYTVLDAHCHRCHTDPPANSAPFPLLTWEHFQADYFGKPVWQRAQKAIQPDAVPRMPYGEDPLPEETRAVLDAWFATCEAGECARADESSSGAGGAGGG
jgi:hypothetical protein